MVYSLNLNYLCKFFDLNDVDIWQSVIAIIDQSMFIKIIYYLEYNY